MFNFFKKGYVIVQTHSLGIFYGVPATQENPKPQT